MKIDNIHEMYDQHTFQIMKMVLSENSSCIDIGAHIGAVLREIIHIAPSGQHFAFEPIPDLFNGLKSNTDFRNVGISDIALSNETGEDTFYWVRNDPAYSGLKQRRYDRPDPEIVEIKVKKARLDDIIPPTQAIDLIKIDVEGGELPVLLGAQRIITEHKPFIVFESGKGASDRYGTNGAALFDYLAEQCGLEINTLDGFLTGQQPLQRERLSEIFDKTERYYFIAHRRLSEQERQQYFQWYVLDLDSRLFTFRAVHQRFAKQLDDLYCTIPPIEIIDWGAKETIAGHAVNRQPNGSSAIWIRARNIIKSEGIYLYFGDQRAVGTATVSDDLLTSDIPATVIQEAGEYSIRIVEPSGRETRIGVFIVRPY
jgi:FkbM family methyltransferase